LRCLGRAETTGNARAFDIRIVTNRNPADMDTAQLKAQANSCRRLALAFANQSTAKMLNRMAAEFDRMARRREAELLRNAQSSH